VPTENNPPEKILHFSNGSTDLKQTFRLCMRLFTQLATSVETTDMVKQKQQFKH